MDIQNIVTADFTAAIDNCNSAKIILENSKIDYNSSRTAVEGCRNIGKTRDIYFMMFATQVLASETNDGSITGIIDCKLNYNSYKKAALSILSKTVSYLLEIVNGTKAGDIIEFVDILDQLIEVLSSEGVKKIFGTSLDSTLSELQALRQMFYIPGKATNPKENADTVKFNPNVNQNDPKNLNSFNQMRENMSKPNDLSNAAQANNNILTSLGTINTQLESSSDAVTVDQNFSMERAKQVYALIKTILESLIAIMDFATKKNSN